MAQQYRSAFLVTARGGVSDGVGEEPRALDSAVRELLSMAEVEYLAGSHSWAVRFVDKVPIAAVRRRLSGVPLEVHANDWVYSAGS